MHVTPEPVEEVPDLSATMLGLKYEDVDELTLHREWPHPIPMNGDRLKFAALVRDLPYGVSESAS